MLEKPLQFAASHILDNLQRARAQSLASTIETSIKQYHTFLDTQGILRFFNGLTKVCKRRVDLKSNFIFLPSSWNQQKTYFKIAFFVDFVKMGVMKIPFEILPSFNATSKSVLSIQDCRSQKRVHIRSKIRLYSIRFDFHFIFLNLDYRTS